MRAKKRDPLLRAFELALGRDPGRALVASPGRTATAAEVDGWAAALAARLEGAGVGPGAAVGMAVPNGPLFLAALVALRRRGAAALLLDARAPEAARRRVAGEVGASHLLAARCGWPAGGDGPADGWRLDRIAPRAAAGAAGAEVIKLTSGSTGAARGIAATTAALLADHAALSATMGIGAGDRLVAAIPFSHSYGLSSLVLPALTGGAALVVPDDDGPFAPLDDARAAGATVFPTVPAYLDALARTAEPPPLPPSLRLVLTAGAPLSAATSARFRERFGLAVHVFYGASECGGICYDREGGAAERGTVGAPVAGVEVAAEPPPDGGADAGCDSAGGDGGRVAVRSAAVASGYLPAGDPRLGGGRFLTQDLGAWKNGELALTGRLDDLINVKGKKVNPREVERVLLALDGVDDVRVFGAVGPARGEAVVRAVIACRPGAVARDQVLAWCRERLSDHQVPRSVSLVGEIPRTERGKIDRAALERL
jgi:long-chain acyl-CoA synthetase